MKPRRTKIIATIGPASGTPEGLRALMLAGVDVARLNFSHGSHADHAAMYRLLREAEAEVGRPIAIMQDLQGPKIRLGRLEKEMIFEAGAEVLLSSDNDFVGQGCRLPTTYAELANDVRVGERVLLADGRLALRVEAIEGREVRARVLVGGKLSSGKGINLPGTSVSLASLTAKDEADLAFGLELGVDYVALSFVRSVHDIHHIRHKMRAMGREIPVIAKIEKPEAVVNLASIVDAADGIMIARGDLGVEVPTEKVPGVQRQGIRLARERGKITVVATQMLVSMVDHARPTSAEVSDVANAVFDGADALMLSEETAVGSYPVRSVETMSNLAAAAEEAPQGGAEPKLMPAAGHAHAFAISRAAVVTAEELKATAIVAHTRSGRGPRFVGHWRPKCLVLGCASTDEDVRRMAFYWGVQPLKIAPPSSVESLVSLVEAKALEKGLLEAGDTVVITSKLPFTETEQTNMLKIHKLGSKRH